MKSKNNLEEFITKYNFTPRGEIKLTSTEEITFELNQLDNKKEEIGFVYLWVIKDKNGNLELLYIGKAGKTLVKRCEQIKKGFNKNNPSTTGKKNRPKIVEILNSERKIIIYARLSEKLKVFDQEYVSACELEERALIMKFSGKNILNVIGNDKF